MTTAEDFLTNVCGMRAPKRPGEDDWNPMTREFEALCNWIGDQADIAAARDEAKRRVGEKYASLADEVYAHVARERIRGGLWATTHCSKRPRLLQKALKAPAVQARIAEVTRLNIILRQELEAWMDARRDP